MRRLAVTLLVIVGCRAKDAAVDKAPPIPGPLVVRVAPGLVDEGRIGTAAVARRSPSGTLRLPADVVPNTEGAAEAGALMGGRVARLESREGDHVKRGQVLAWLDAPEAARTVADLIRARARSETSARKVARLEGLVAAEAASKIALEDARLELDLARADLAAARTLVASLGLGDAASLPVQLPVKSPVDGVVVERSAVIGAHVSPDARMFRLVQEGQMMVVARVADGTAASVVTGSDVQLEPRSGVRCPGRVLGTLPEVDASTRTRRVRIAPADACAGLVAGAQIEVEVTLTGPEDPARRVLVVPDAALVQVKSATVVFVARAEKGTYEVRAIEPGAQTGADRVVLAGLAEGERVVVGGVVLLKGEIVRSELGGEP